MDTVIVYSTLVVHLNKISNSSSNILGWPKLTVRDDLDTFLSPEGVVRFVSGPVHIRQRLQVSPSGESNIPGLTDCIDTGD